ncbi:ABC transporter [Azospirillum sp. TSO22-1]|nr:ABC transporter [Azospirillum sp. TSO22-1]
MLFAPPLAVVVILVLGVLLALGARLSPEELWAALLAPETLFALRLSLLTSLAALGMAAALGVPAGWLLARRSFPGKAAVDTLLDLPLVMPPLVAGLGLLFLFGRRLLGEPLVQLGLEILFSPLGVVVAQGFVATLVLLRAAKAAFLAVDPRMVEVAGTLRAAPWDVFRSVELPLAAPGLAAGAVLAWARAVGEFGATLMLAGATRFHTETLPVAVFLNIATGETGVAVACALVLLAVAFVLLLAIRSLGAKPPGPAPRT